MNYSWGRLGIGISSVLIISRWLSANALFTASEITLTYGIIAGCLFGIIGAIAFYTFGFIGYKARQQYKETESLQVILQGKLDSRTKNVFLLLIGIGYLLDFLILAMGASIILYITFHLPMTWGVLLFIFLGLPLLFFGFIRDIGKLAIYKIGLLQIVILILFVYLFLTSDIEAMFFNMKLYHPYMFSINIEELIFYIASIFFIFLGKLLTDFATWRILFQVKEDKIRQSFILSGSIWATVPLCFSIIIFPALSLGGFVNTGTLYDDLFQLLGSPVFIFISAATLLGTLLTTYFSRLTDFFRFLKVNDIKQRKPVNFFLIAGLAILFYGYVIFHPSIIDLFFFTGILNVSLLAPILMIIFSKKLKRENLVMMTVLTNTGLGYIYYFSLTQHFAIVMTVITSIFISLIHLDRDWD